MSSGTVKYETDRGVAIITISRPEKRNSITSAVADGLEKAWLRFEEGDERVAVLRGDGPEAFTGGVDLADPPMGHYPYVPGLGVPVSKPVICAVSGWCVGVGLAFVEFADLCVATESACFYYPEAALGLGRGILAGLAARIPHKIAAEIMMLGGKIPAARLEQHGLINRLTTYEDLLPTAMEMATTIAAQDSRVGRFYKSNLEAVLNPSPGEIAERVSWQGDQLPGNRAALVRRARRLAAANPE